MIWFDAFIGIALGIIICDSFEAVGRLRNEGLVLCWERRARSGIGNVGLLASHSGWAGNARIDTDRYARRIV